MIFLKYFSQNFNLEYNFLYLIQILIASLEMRILYNLCQYIWYYNFIYI